MAMIRLSYGELSKATNNSNNQKQKQKSSLKFRKSQKMRRQKKSLWTKQETQLRLSNSLSNHHHTLLSWSAN